MSFLLGLTVICFAGSECYPTCFMPLDVDLHDPVLLPNGTAVDSLKHWMLPVKVQVRARAPGHRFSEKLWSGNWSNVANCAANVLSSDIPYIQTSQTVIPQRRETIRAAAAAFHTQTDTDPCCSPPDILIAVTIAIKRFSVWISV